MARLLVLIGLAAIWITGSSEAATRRVALVVGAANYAHAPALAHTLDDARGVAAALARLDFEVDLVLNPDRAALENAVRRLGQKSHGVDASLFYFSGHALESQGVNWLLPVSADVHSDRELRFEALDLSAVLEQMEGSARVALVFLDACREDPFKQRLGVVREVTRAGLAPPNAIASGTYLAFATAPGMTAADGNGPHSPFTGALLKYIETPGLEVRQMMSKVSGEVEAATDGRQIPWDGSSLRGDFYFDPGTTGEPVIRAINGPNPQVDLDALFWESVRSSKNPKDFGAYLLKFPQGMFAEIARNRLAELNVPPLAPAADPKWLNALSQLAASVPQKTREDVAAAYQAGGVHKSLAVNPSNGGASWFTGAASEQEAEERTLERCEINHGGPCVLLAMDETIEYTNGDPATLRPMPRVHYAGPFDPERIPYVAVDVRHRPDVVSYSSAPGFKAAAYHARGDLFIISGAPNQHAAEERVLAVCNADPSRQGKTGPCYLYASNNDVVLPRRSSTPITAAAAIDTPPIKPPVVIALPFHDALLAQLERTLPTLTAAARDSLAKNYEAAPMHKALALHAKDGGTYRFVSWSSADAAEQATLEGCQIYYDAPCELLAVDDASRADASGNFAMHDMPRVRYGGAFDLDKIPAISPAIRGRADIESYARAPAAKAMAFHPWGQIYAVTGAKNQNEAETGALAACNGEQTRNAWGGPCYLYASANQVVLPRRLRQPLTPAAAAVAPPPPPPPSPRAGTRDDDTALLASLIERITNTAPLVPQQALPLTVQGYLQKSEHRAIAAGGRFLVSTTQSTSIGAETLAMEQCQLLQAAPCTLMGSDRDVAPALPLAGTKWYVRSMPKMLYAETFDTGLIPGIDDSIRHRADIIEYNRAPAPKAVAITAGKVAVVTQAKSQYEAEFQALATCGPICLLYAAGNRVVLPQYLRVPRPLGKSLAEVLSYLQGDESGPASAAQYNKARAHKAMASLPDSGRTFFWGGASGSDNAELLAIEACDLLYNAACVIVAADDKLRTSDPAGAVRRTSPRLTYEGPYRADMVPLFIGPPSEARDYLKLREPKAMAIRPSGPRIAIATGASLADAEANALSRCSEPDSPFPCFLYAANQQTILPQRRTEPQP
jgi:uncharacterized caspase-like protein